MQLSNALTNKQWMCNSKQSFVSWFTPYYTQLRILIL